MGRLFWKLFAMCWLAQVAASLCVGFAFWAGHEHQDRLRAANGEFAQPSPEWRGRPPPERVGSAPDDSHGFGPGPRFEQQPGEPPSPGRGLGPPQLGRPPSGFARPGGPGGPGGLGHMPLSGPWFLMLPVLLPIAAGGIVSLLFAALLARHFSKPIRHLQQAFSQVAAGRLGTRVGTASGVRGDELGDLTRGFDSMAERLQSMKESQDRLLHDVSHELRSPLARLQVAADLMRQQPERSAEFAQRIERDTERMDTLIGELLTLARLDADPRGGDEDIDLDAIVRVVADDAAIEMQAKAGGIVLQLETSTHVRGRIALLHRAIENIVRNAVAHSPPERSVSIAAQLNAARSEWQLTVSDEGPGVPVADVERIFEAFYRVPSSRAGSGHGLGLAIARRAIEAHGGRVQAVNRAQSGLVVTIVLPLA